MNRDTRLLPYILAYESVMKSVELSDEAHDIALAGIMTQMEQQLKVPYLNDESFNREHPEVIALFRKVGNSRVTLGDDTVFHVGNKIQLIDGEQRRTAKAYEKKNLGESVRFICVDESGEWGYAFETSSIEWNGEVFIYDCQKHHTSLSAIIDRGGQGQS